MATLLELYTYVFTTVGDPRTASWPLMASPIPIVLILGIYLYFVTSFGPIAMMDFKPFELKKTMLLYNAGQVVTCAYVVYKSFTLGWGGHYRMICEPIDYSYDERAVGMAKIVYIYMLLKLVDLLDTVFCVLRKKNSQITFLHVYHHMGMVGVGWASAKYIPGGHGTMLGFLNSIVHMVMYSYYFLTLLDNNHKKSMWWKKHITQLQLLQFVLDLYHFSTVFMVSDCAYPWWPSMLVIPQTITMIILFTDFYIKDYMKPTVKQADKEPKVTKAAMEDFANKEENKLS